MPPLPNFQTTKAIVMKLGTNVPCYEYNNSNKKIFQNSGRFLMTSSKYWKSSIFPTKNDIYKIGSQKKTKNDFLVLFSFSKRLINVVSYMLRVFIMCTWLSQNSAQNYKKDRTIQKLVMTSSSFYVIKICGMTHSNNLHMFWKFQVHIIITSKVIENLLFANFIRVFMEKC